MEKITNKELENLIYLIDGSWYTALCESECELITAGLKELQTLRKIDIAGTLKYAEEAGAAIEELKYGIEEAIKEIDSLSYMTGSDDTVRLIQGSSMTALVILKKHVSEYLDENEG